MLRDDGSPYPTVYYDQIMAGDQGVRVWLETIVRPMFNIGNLSVWS